MLRVVEEDGCPLFRSGDQMLLDLPAVDSGSSSHICAPTVRKLLTDAESFDCAEGIAPPPKFICPRPHSPVTFEVEALPELAAKPPPTQDMLQDIAAAVSYLRSVPIFAPLPAPFLSQLAHRIRIERHDEGSIVLEKGQSGRAFFVIREGVLEIRDFAEGQVSSVVTRLRSRDCFGEMSILTRSPVAATVVAQGKVVLYVIAKADFESMLRENPFMAASFTRLMAARLAAANFRIVQEGAKSFSGKLAVMSLATVLQVLADSMRSGTLEVKTHHGERASVGFNRGAVYQIEAGPMRGEDALVHMMAWTDGEFWLDARRIPEKDDVQAGMMNLLLESMRRLDEQERDG
ncbi:MAG: DUF4388 domain-containing protein [Myxococcota bacterium]